jgi:hypothetical protein
MLILLSLLLGTMGSLPLGIIFHWIGNQEYEVLIDLLRAVLGGN